MKGKEYSWLAEGDKRVAYKEECIGSKEDTITCLEDEAVNIKMCQEGLEEYHIDGGNTFFNEEEKVVFAVSLNGRLYKQDNLTVQNIVLRKISDASDAFTYVKPYIKKDNGRTDIKALRSRYENVAMQEQYVSEAKRTIETIQYRNEI